MVFFSDLIDTSFNDPPELNEPLIPFAVSLLCAFVNSGDDEDDEDDDVDDTDGTECDCSSATCDLAPIACIAFFDIALVSRILLRLWLLLLALILLECCKLDSPK